MKKPRLQQRGERRIAAALRIALAAALLGGAFVGIGVGLIVRQGGSSGGDDALALVIHQLTGWKLARSYLFTDLVVLGA